MPSRNSSGRSNAGRRGSSRTNSGGKSFSGKGKTSGKSFRKSDSGDTKRSSSGKDEKKSFGKKPGGFSKSSGSYGRPYKKTYGKKEEGSSDARGGGSYSEKRAGSFSKRPYKKFDSDDRGKSSDKSGSDSRGGSYGEKRAGGFSKRPYKKFDSDDRGKSFDKSDRGSRGGTFKKSDKPYAKKDEGSPDSKAGSFGSKRAGGFSKRPYKKFDSDDKGKSFDRGADSQSRGEERPFKRPDKPFGKRSEGPDSERSSFRKGPSEKRFRGKSSGTPFSKPESDNESSAANQDSPREDRGFFKKSKSRYAERPRSKKSSEEAGAPAQTEKIRLNKYIANSGVCSRREADELITMGLITVNGKTISELGYKVNPGDEVRYENRVLTAEKPVYILLNKPKGYLTTTDDPQDRNTVMHLVGNAVKERIYPVGRLDRNTTGLLLLTNDGELAEKLMHPSYNIKKIYKVELDRPLTKADFQTILEGVQLEEGRAMVDDLAIVSEDGKTVGLELHIGWNRVVRRIFEALQYEVLRLDRSVYAGLDKKDLGRGHWRFLTREEIVRLKHYK